MYVNTSATVDGKNYIFDTNGVATESNYAMDGNLVKVSDKNGKFSLVKEFLTHPGIASGEVSDVAVSYTHLDVYKRQVCRELLRNAPFLCGGTPFSG